MTDVERYRRMTGEIAAALQSQDFGWSEGTSEPDQLAWLADLVRDTKARRIAEVGFHAGFSSHAFLDASPDARVVSFDLGEHPHLAAAKRLVDERFPGRHLLVCGDSRISVPAYAGAHPDARSTSSSSTVDTGMTSRARISRTCASWRRRPPPSSWTT